MSGLERFQEHLRELLQLDTADLDVGIYRLFAARREEVERFIDEELPVSVDAAFSDLLGEEGKGAAERLQELTAQIVSEAEDEQAILPDGCINPECADKAGKTLRTLIQEYEELRRSSAKRTALEEQKDDTYNHLYAFFSRYYDEGDFIPRHFFGARNRYVVPYNGEETLFHWANRDQYYVKSGEHFRDYAFQVDTIVGPWRIQFRIVEASTPTGNTKGDTRLFFPLITERKVDTEQRTATILFHYRLPTEQEVKRYGPKLKGQVAVLHEAGPAILKTIPDPMLAGVLAKTVYQTEKETLTLLDKRPRHFTRKNTTDCFVHKRLREFLLDELEFYIRDQVVHLMDMDADADSLEKKRLSVRVFRRLAERIIDFLARIEDAQKTLFEKKKLALAVDYLVPIEHVPEDLWPEVLSSKVQSDQWKDWFSIKPKKDLFNQKGEINQTFLEQHPTLTVDTRCFANDFKLRLLCALSERFGDLDEATDGLLIHSGNFQALNYLLPRYEGEVKCIYIDPPYNTGKDGFVYKDKYRHGSWASMIESRIALGNRILNQAGVFLCSIGDDELQRLINLVESGNGERNLLGIFIWNTEGNIDNQSKIKQNHEYVICWTREEHSVPAPTTIDPNVPKTSKLYKDIIVNTIIKNGPANPISDIILPAGFPADFDEGKITPGKAEWPKFEETVQVRDGKLVQTLTIRSGWSSKRLIENFISTGMKPIRDSKGNETTFFVKETGAPHVLKRRSESQSHVVTVLRNMGSTQSMSAILKSMGFSFDYPKPIGLIKYLTSCFTPSSSIVLDHFAGSGTTGHAVINLNREDGGRRKFILVEMGDYFNTVLVPRIAKVIYTPEWKDGKPKRMATQEEADRSPRLVKILKLESYEDALHNLTNQDQIKNFPEPDESDGARRIAYVLDRLLEKNDSMLDWEALDRPFDYAMEVLTDDGVKTAPVDLVETFNALYGLRVQRIEIWLDPETNREYRVIKAAKADKGNVLVVWRNVPPESEAGRDRAFLEERIGDLGEWNEAWINGPCAVPGLKPLDGIFKRLITGPRY